MTASWCRSRCSTTATRRSTARRRACSTATAPTASPCRPPSTPTALSLADRGFVYAIAHVRGGKDKGFSWYEDGKREKKTNTFRDFIAVAEHLVAERYTAHDRIVAQGGSAGGMLMGAVANMAPDAFRRHHRRGAVRRRAVDHARRHAAADPAGMAGMGQSDRLRGRLPHDRRLFALRQCRRACLSADPGGRPA